MSQDQSASWSGIAEVLADAEPYTWRRLLAEHTADRRGCCRSCRRSSGLTTTWPCMLRLIAEEAERLAEDRAQGQRRLAAVPD